MRDYYWKGKKDITIREEGEGREVRPADKEGGICVEPYGDIV